MRAAALRLLLAVALLPWAATAAVAQEAGSGGVNRADQLASDYVILISFDGFRHDYLDRTELPAFARIARAGVRADGLIPVFPSKTFPNHYSIATGMYPETHGLVGNEFYDPVRGESYSTRDRSKVQDGSWYGGEPIWVTAERQGMVTAAYFFVGTEAPIGGVLPTYWRVYDGAVAEEARVDQALEWLRLPPERRPHLILLYFSNLDDAGHRHGPDSPEVVAALRRVDSVLERLVEGVARTDAASRVSYVLVSDHGMTAVDPARTEFLDDHADLTGVSIDGLGPYAVLWVPETERRQQIRETLRDGLQHARVWLREEVPDRLRYTESPRIGDIVVAAEPGWQVTLREHEHRLSAGGTHGWDPAAEDMRGLFLAAGPSLKAGLRLPAFENVHIYPFLARLLGLRPNPDIDGSHDALLPALEPR